MGCGDEFAPVEPSHRHGNRARYRVHDDRGRAGGGVRGVGRYDLKVTGPSQTTVTLTYDWSAVPPHVREYLQFPPFGAEHLDNSLQHLSDLIGSAK